MKLLDLAWFSDPDAPLIPNRDSVATFAGIFLIWLVHRSLASSELVDDWGERIEASAREGAPPSALAEAMDGKISTHDLSPRIVGFAANYFEPTNAVFLTDLASLDQLRSSCSSSWQAIVTRGIELLDHRFSKALP